MEPTINVSNSEDPQRARSRFSIQGLWLAAMLVLAIGVALVLSFALFRSLQNSTVVQVPSESAEREADASKTLQFSAKPAELPELRFVDRDGRSLTLRDFAGRPILLNLWATWCVPCRKEMASLDRLQAKFDPSRFLVLALSVDRGGVPTIERFYQQLGLKLLGVYVDQYGSALQDLRAPGLPITLLVNEQGQEIGRKIGPAEWDAPQIVSVLRERLRLLAEKAVPETQR
ncbi:MAG TPA: TlpA disulfide reductase family protein [Roseiarcus sp.]|nr:TlpA disulfide reductase family protein [Roseiarcus sp.]